MCGIAGVIGLGAPLGAEERATTERMLSMLYHRGPDSRGILPDERCVLGNTRLKIIDPSNNADLPMSGAGGSLRLAYNGEVTNFRELKARFKLEEKYGFHSESDTEVVLHLFKELGLDFLEHLSGMFAFCLYDRAAGKVYLVRDFYGLRPLFYAVKNGRLYFGSEIKALLECPAVEKKLDHEALWHYFSLAYIPGAHTPFQEIRELEGGSLIEVDLREGSWSQRSYHQIRYVPDHSRSFEETVRGLRGLLSDSMARNLISDAPVGLTLSGGVDTSGLLALAKEMGVSERLHTFSIRVKEPSFDESRFQRIMSEFAGSIHHEIAVGPAEVLENLAAPMAYLDEPSGDGAAVPLFLLAKEAHKHVRVLISGEGGDEIFNAYETHRAYKVRGMYRRLPAPLRQASRALARRLPVSYQKLSFDFLSKRFTEGAEKNVPGAHFYWRHACSNEDKRALLPRLMGFPETERLFEEVFDGAGFEDELDRLSLIDIRYYFIGDLMVKNDRMLMAHSIEGRYPYMDRELVEFACGIPTRWKVRGFQGRYIQKEAMRDILPSEIYRRPNMGLEMPHSIWFLNEFRSVGAKYFSKENVGRTEMLDHRAVGRLWEEHLSRKRDNGRALWTILNYLIWFDLFVDGSGYKSYLPKPA